MATKFVFWIINAQIIVLLFLVNLDQQRVSAKGKEKINVYFFPAGVTEYEVRVYLHDNEASAKKNQEGDAYGFDDEGANAFSGFTKTQPDGRQMITVQSKLEGKYLTFYFKSTSKNFTKNLIDQRLITKKMATPEDVKQNQELAFVLG